MFYQRFFLSAVLLMGVLLPTTMADIPSIYSNIHYDKEGRMYFAPDAKTKYYRVKEAPVFTREQMIQAPQGYEQGLAFDFNHSPMFYFPLDKEEVLQTGEASAELKEIFQQHGISLNQATVLMEKDNVAWVIEDREYHHRFKVLRSRENFSVWYELQGTLYYGFIKHGDGPHPYPVYYKTPAKIRNGLALVKITKLSGKYDMINWQETGRGTLGYRVVDHLGNILYDGKVAFRGTGPFTVDTCIAEGPFVNQVTSTQAVISFATNLQAPAKVKINKQVFSSDTALQHEITITDLKPDTRYSYTVKVGDYSERYSLQTAPAPGSRTSFTFAYASDSRSGQGGGERNIKGSNAYIMKKIFALASHRRAAFVQFTGDMIDGYRLTKEETMLEYSNWKRAIEPFAHYLPCYVGMGNHEALVHQFDDNSKWGITIDKFPFATQSAEVAFAEAFVNPNNGPKSEDNTSYDPDPEKENFPTYQESVYYYTHDNVAMVVLNSDYWYAPSLKYHPGTSGNLHAYIMDQQLAWLEKTLSKLQQDDKIDHIFVTQHTPAFPNGGHVGDDMWYSGNNQHRPVISGKKVAKGIIERRDQYLKALMENSKVVGILTGDEHNYCRLHLTKNTNIYPKDWPHSKITEQDYFRELWQINNGAAGAPYYAQEQVPWTDATAGFTTQNALVLFHVNGEKLSMEVVNPDTLSSIETLKLR